MNRERPVAVVIACFNAARTLGATIESALAQGDLCEIVVVDDGSTDASLQIARSFGERVAVLDGPNRGVSHARNRGAAATKAPWLLFLDSDDLLVEGTLAARLEVARESGANVVICDWDEAADDGAGKFGKSQRRTLDWAALRDNAECAIADHVWATTAAILYARPLFEKTGGFRSDLPVIQDARLLFDAAFAGAQFAHAPHAGAIYRVLPGSLSRRDPARFYRDILHNGAQIETLWRSRGALSAAQEQTLANIYNTAARGLFSCADAGYFDATAALAALPLAKPLHMRLANPLARAVGLPRARALFQLVGRG
ncbi:MAG: glycosyltransferase [Hyphomicrobiales bacterium]|nr:glycosyltransferase [Hyphomicrobiales bacterium]